MMPMMFLKNFFGEYNLSKEEMSLKSFFGAAYYKEHSAVLFMAKLYLQKIIKNVIFDGFCS